MEDLFAELSHVWIVSISDENLKHIIYTDWDKISDLEERHNFHLCTMLWSSLRASRMEYLINEMPEDRRIQFIHDDIIESVYSYEGIEYLFIFIDRYLNRRFSLIYEIERYADVSSILDDIRETGKMGELIECIKRFNVNPDGFDI